MIRCFLRILGLWPKKCEEQYIENNCFAFADVLESHSNSYITHQDYLSIPQFGSEHESSKQNTRLSFSQ